MNVIKFFTTLIIGFYEISALPASPDRTVKSSNPNLKLFSPYGEYPSTIQEIINLQDILVKSADIIVAGENINSKIDKNNGAQNSEDDAVVIQKVAPKAYRIETVETPRVITTYQKIGDPAVDQQYAEIIQKVLRANDITSRSIPFGINGFGTEGKTIIYDNSIITEKAPLKLLIVDGRPIVYSIRNENSGLKQRTIFDPATFTIGSPVILTLPSTKSDGKSDETVYSYYQCENLNSNNPAVCIKQAVKTVKADRTLSITPSVSVWPGSQPSRSGYGGKWRDYIKFSIDENPDLAINDDHLGEEGRIRETRIALDDKAAPTSTDDDIKDVGMKKIELLLFPKRKRCQHSKNKPVEKSNVSSQQVDMKTELRDLPDDEVTTYRGEVLNKIPELVDEYPQLPSEYSFLKSKLKKLAKTDIKNNIVF